jgi:hypothetical protein
LRSLRQVFQHSGDSRKLKNAIRCLTESITCGGRFR